MVYRSSELVLFHCADLIVKLISRVMSSVAKNCGLFYSLFARCQSLARRFVNVNLSGWVIYARSFSRAETRNATWSFKYGYGSFSLAVSCPWPYLSLRARVRSWASLSSERSPINLGQMHLLRLVKGMVTMSLYKAALLQTGFSLSLSLLFFSLWLVINARGLVNWLSSNFPQLGFNTASRRTIESINLFCKLFQSIFGSREVPTIKTAKILLLLLIFFHIKSCTLFIISNYI